MQGSLSWPFLEVVKVRNWGVALTYHLEGDFDTAGTTGSHTDLQPVDLKIDIFSQGIENVGGQQRAL